MSKDPFQAWMWDFKTMKYMKDAGHNILASEMIADLRDEKARQRVKYNDAINSLKPTVQALERDPEFVSRADGTGGAIYHLESHRLILRTEPKDDEFMQLKILSQDIPFAVQSSIEMLKGRVIPAVDLREEGERDEKSFVAAIEDELIRVSEVDGKWSVSA